MSWKLRIEIMKHTNTNAHGTLSSLATGFFMSILLTLSAYLIVTEKLVSTDLIIPVIAFLALMQFIVQMVFFLHLDKEIGPRWNLVAFFATLAIVIILIIGSIWIMNSLNYHMMPKDINEYMQWEEGIYKKPLD